jgi:hypothetical protein
MTTTILNSACEPIPVDLPNIVLGDGSEIALMNDPEYARAAWNVARLERDLAEARTKLTAARDAALQRKGSN